MKNERTKYLIDMTLVLLLAVLCAFALAQAAFSAVRKEELRDNQNTIALTAIEMSRLGESDTEQIMRRLSIGNFSVVQADGPRADETAVSLARSGRVAWDEKNRQTLFLLGDRLCAVRARPMRFIPRMGFLYFLLMGVSFFLCCVIVDKMYLSVVSRSVDELSCAAGRIAQGNYDVRVQPKKHASKNMKQLYESFNGMAAALSSVEYLRRDFTQSISHEIKTPIAAIHSYAQLMQLDNLPEAERIACATAIARQSRRLSSLSDSLLRLTRLESQKTPLSIARCRIGAALQEETAALLPEIEQKRIELTVDLPDVLAEADEELFVQAYRNLLENAVKFTPEGGSIRVTLKRTPTLLTLSVADTGCGIAEEAIPHIFEKFYQADASHATQGAGLGLVLVLRIMQLHGGRVEVQSQPGAGSEFRLLLDQRA